jgi:hypothetical protein
MCISQCTISIGQECLPKGQSGWGETNDGDRKLLKIRTNRRDTGTVIVAWHSELLGWGDPRSVTRLECICVLLANSNISSVTIIVSSGAHLVKKSISSLADNLTYT